MFPLKKREITGYKFGDKTFYSNFHLGTDYGTEGMEVLAPFKGKVVYVGIGIEGGKTIHFRPNGQDILIRFLHLSQFLCKQGDLLEEGTLMAITGNTGESSLGHLHLDISKNSVQLNNINNFIDPEKFGWEGVLMDDGFFKAKDGITLVYFHKIGDPSELKGIGKLVKVPLPLKDDGSVDFDKLSLSNPADI